MTPPVTSILTWGRLLVGGAALIAASPSFAQMSGKSPNASDVAMTPLTDLNLAKDPIPEILLLAVEDAYANEGLDGCDQIGNEIAALDAVLGPDFDLGQKKRGRISAGRLAQRAIGSFIPFRGFIRELSGAADHQRDFQEAILAGAVRRGYLKGLGEALECPYPARPAFVRVTLDSDESAEQQQDEGTAGEPASQPIGYESRPVIQGED